MGRSKNKRTEGDRETKATAGKGGAGSEKRRARTSDVAMAETRRHQIPGGHRRVTSGRFWFAHKQIRSQVCILHIMSRSQTACRQMVRERPII